MTVTERLHHLVHQLPEGVATTAAERILAHLRSSGDDQVLRALMHASLDHEVETDDERTAIAEGLVALRRGDVLSDAEFRREIGM